MQLHDENVLKRRMLGAAVLIALAVIFLPLILDGSGTENQFRRVESLDPEPARIPQVVPITEIPEVTDTPLQSVPINNSTSRLQPFDGNEASADTAIESTKAKLSIKPAPAVVVAPSKIAPEKVSIPKPKETKANTLDKKANAKYAIQVASFGDKINALNLRNKLRVSNLPVFVKVGQSNSKQVFRVFVGPISGKKAAQDVQAQLNKSYNHQTLLVGYKK